MNSALFRKGLESGSNIIEHINVAHMDGRTPCSEWNIRQLLNHMVYEVAWIPELLAGKTIAEVGDALDGDLLGDDPVGAWEKHATLALAAVEKASEDSIVHLSYGDGPAGRYVNEVGGDVVVHAWDLAKALGVDFHIDDETAAQVMAATEHIMPMGRKYELIGAELPVNEGASGEEKLLAKFGRSSEWTA